MTGTHLASQWVSQHSGAAIPCAALVCEACRKSSSCCCEVHALNLAAQAANRFTSPRRHALFPAWRRFFSAAILAASSTHRAARTPAVTSSASAADFQQRDAGHPLARSNATRRSEIVQLTSADISGAHARSDEQRRVAERNQSGRAASMPACKETSVRGIHTSRNAGAATEGPSRVWCWPICVTRITSIENRGVGNSLRSTHRCSRHLHCQPRQANPSWRPL